MTESTLDLRERPPAERHAAVFEAFESIDPGESLTVVNDHDPSPLLHQMAAELSVFDADASTIDRTGPERFEATLPKREPSASNGDPDPAEAVVEALRTVTDPDLGLDVVEAGLVDTIAESSGGDGDGTALRIGIDGTGVDEPTLADLETDIETAVLEGTDVESIEIVRQGSTTPPSVSSDEVRDRLGDVQHPDLADDVVASGLVEDVEVTDGTVTIAVTDPDLGGGIEDYRGEFLDLLGTAAYNAAGVTGVRVDTGDAVVPIDPPRTEDPPLADAPDASGPPAGESPSPLQHGADQGSSAPPTIDLAGIETVLLVASAKGGVGKTTVATQLAHGLADRGTDVGLLDADFTGPDVAQSFGLEPRITEGSVIEPVEHEGIDVVSVGLMENSPTAWNGDMVHNALFNLLEDVDWSVETLVVDLPPGASDTLMTLLQFVPIDGVVLVTTPYPTSVADTNEGATLFREGDVPVLGVVCNMVRFACPSCGDEHDLFPGADLDDALDYPVLARLPFDPDLRSFDGDRPDSLDSLVQTVSERLTTEDDLTVPEDAVDVRDLPEHGRIEAVVDAAAGLDPGDTLTVVSDRHPADLAVALVDALGVDGSPSEVFPTYEVTASDPDEWILRVRPPADATLSST